MPAGQAKKSVPKTKEEMPEYKQFAHLHGQGIWISEAARKYASSGIYQRLITAWVVKGLIRKIRDDGNRVIVDEQDVAYCAYVYRHVMHSAYKGKRPRRIFTPAGIPYVPPKK